MIESAFVRIFASLAVALRTHVLVAVGAAAFTDLGIRLLGSNGATRIISYLVSGIGFLSAGVIVKEGAQIRGLNTAATLWRSAALGTFASAELWAGACVVAVFVVAGNTLLRPLVNYLNKLPIDVGQPRRAIRCTSLPITANSRRRGTCLMTL